MFCAVPCGSGLSFDKLRTSGLLKRAARMSDLTVDQVYVARNRCVKRLQQAVERVARAVRDGV